MHIDETKLPGIGVRHDFRVRSGRRLGVVDHRDGQRELVVSDADDPDACAVSLTLTGAESDALAELLGAPRIGERLARLRSDVEGISTGQVTVEPGSPFSGRTLGDTATRTRTGASIVALLRRDDVITSPRPDQRLAAGDRVVVVGTLEGVRAVIALFEAG